MAKIIAIRLSHPEIGSFRWRAWRDARKPAGWMMSDHTGYVRNVGNTWAEAVMMIRLIADNHGASLVTPIS